MEISLFDQIVRFQSLYFLKLLFQLYKKHEIQSTSNEVKNLSKIMFSQYEKLE